MRIVDDKLLASFRVSGRCGWCNQWCVRLEPHHIFARGMGNGPRQLDVPINLLPVGSSQALHPCHRVIEDGGEKMAAEALRITLKLMGPGFLGHAEERPHDAPDVLYRRALPLGHEAAGLTAEQQELFWKQLGLVPKRLPAVDPSISEPEF